MTEGIRPLDARKGPQRIAALRRRAAGLIRLGNE